MAKIRVIFGHQIRLNYGDPQPMALRGRLVAVAEIAPELLTVANDLQLVFTFCAQYGNSTSSAASESSRQASATALVSCRSTAVVTTEAEVTGTASSTTSPTSTVAFTSGTGSTATRIYGVGLAGVLVLGLLMSLL